MTELPGRVALIGAGQMGAALAAGWMRLKRGLEPSRLLVVDPRPSEPAQELIEARGLARLDALDADTAASVDTFVLALKPQVLAETAPALGEIAREDALVVSIAAGVTLRTLERAFPGRPIVRAMPNTPSAIGKGITVAVANAAADAAGARAAAERLLKAGGAVEWIEDERLMGAVTAVSGSGPAYVFLLCEALAAAGQAEGLPRALAERLAAKTVAGAGALIEKSGDPTALRRAVASPGGTTQAALDVLMSGPGLPGLLRNAVAAAERRSRQLGQD